MKEKLIITGDRGGVGTVLAKGLSDYEIIGMDKQLAQPDRGYVQHQADITNPSGIQDLFAQVAPVSRMIHLAGDPRVDAPFESVLENNIKGTKNIYEGARKTGIEMVIFASSNHVTGAYEGFPPSLHEEDSPQQITVYDPIAPDGDYGSGKAYGEALARQYYEMYGIRSACLRIGTFRPDNDPTVDDRWKKTWLSHQDLVQLVRKSLTSNVGFGIYYGVSNNDGKFWDISNAQREIGYEPKDNAALLTQSKEL